MNNLAALVEPSQNLPIRPMQTTTQFTYPEVTRFPINIDQLARDTENNIINSVDTVVHNQHNKIVTKMAKVSDAYRQDIEDLTKKTPRGSAIVSRR